MTSIVFDRVSKQYFKGPRYFPSLRDFLGALATGKKVEYEKFYAVRDMTFAINRGESVGFVGNNGAGKTTLLKLISRVALPDRGTIKTEGKIAGLLELGAGFHPELTGRENIMFNGMLLGNSKQEMAEKYEKILEFSGLKSFIDMPVKHFSSGMYARLGFAVAIFTDPDVLLVDEVLSVGDEAFQNKCIEKMEVFFGSEQKTVVFVTHNLDLMKRFCNRVLWIDKGRIRSDGNAREVVDEYRKSQVV